MPGYNPKYNDHFDDLDDDFGDSFDDSFDDDFDDGPDDFSDFEDLMDFEDSFDDGFYAPHSPHRKADARRPEEWERYLDRMDPASARPAAGRAGRVRPSAGVPGAARPDARRRERRPAARSGGRDRYREFDRREHPEDVRKYDSSRREPKRGRSGGKGRAGLVLFVLLLIAAGVGAYVWFFTDLYYVAAVRLEQTQVNMFVGEDVTIDHKITTFGSGSPGLEWSSTDPAVASVDGEGAVQARTPGTATITLLEPSSGLSAQCEISVHSVDEMVLSADELTLGEGESYVMHVQTGTQSTETPVFVCSDSSVAEVDSAGQVTALQPGETDITVTARGFNDTSFHVTVMAAPTVISASDAEILCKGETRQLTAVLGEGEYSSKYSYSSDNPSVITVDENGLMTAAGEGTAGVTLSVYNGVSCTVPVTVGKEAGDVTVPKKLTAYNGLPKAIGAADSTGNCRQFFYTSSDPEVLQVDEDGNIHALRAGTATVTCTSYNGKSAKCKVTAKIVDHTTPYTSQRVRENIAALAATYPELISTESIGSSVQGRDITLVKLGTGERKVLVVAGMHSRENIAVSFTMRCIEEYAQAAAEGKRYSGRYNVKKLLEEFTIYLVPLLNPDGLDIIMGLDQPEYTDQPFTEEELAEFKNTANGVNLNRNFPFEWGYEGINTTTPDGRSYAGSSAGSEPETQAIVSLCAQHDFEWLLDMHCKGHLIYYQDKVTGATEESNKLARRLYSRCDFTLTDASTVYEISGGLENWFRKEYGKPGICVELVGSKYSPLVNNLFETKLDWERTRGVFLMCLED